MHTNRNNTQKIEIYNKSTILSSSNTINQQSSQEPVAAQQFAENANRQRRVAQFAMNQAVHQIRSRRTINYFLRKRQLSIPNVN